MAKVLKADHARRIELEGVGSAPRPVDIDQAQTGFTVLRTLRIYRFEPPALVHGHAEEDEVFIVVLRGEIELQIKSERWTQSGQRFALRAADAAHVDAAQPVTCAAYLPPHAEYTLAARSAADVAYARARPASGRPPAVFSTQPLRAHGGSRLLLDASTHAELLRLQLWSVTAHEGGAELAPGDRPLAAEEALIHVRVAPGHAATVDAPGLPGVALDSWDTLALAPGERPQIRVAPGASAIGLWVTAA